jgi:hypothetical protein
MMLYHSEKTLRQNPSGARFVSYRYGESFGRETREAHSWGCREKRGTGKIWLKPGETLDDGIARRRAENC